MSLASNVLFHLFNYPRAPYAKSNCLLYSRLYIDSLSSPTNFSQINNFLSVDDFSEDVANLFKNLIRNFKLKVCF